MTLSPIDPNQPFQLQYQPAINELVNYLRAGLGKQLHSVYLYGSVARKTAQPNASNLDVIVVTYESIEQNRTTLLNTIRWRFQKRFPFITDVSVKTALVSQVASLDSLFSWGFMLRHCSVCVYGDNLAECFGDYETSWEIAKHWNMDVEDWLHFYRDKIAKANTAQEQGSAQQIIAKKLLRASYSLVMPQDKNWFDDPKTCGTHFLRYFPEKQKEIERLTILLSGKVIPKRSVIGLLDSFGPWLIKQYQKTEFRIG
ncbi:nucleotidyltransferase domain-containing protein [Vibrio cincinnatiensis]|jgi:predicted nucleotidyltransferase|uniref:Nucleotidyltransferase domain-containing protein n=1 Tax=Vibrio cincinnatiensis DSM 19608 TaxID=1123491 RepID=A0A1T4KF02_VIBCI|nr:nucleotidyltransferase domain-containing protein [Vibrio cincinnatiensis]MCG3721956.1 nucleotidyltransferase domain-containing protein [Vibrio cincinnatiensis]MCG3724391.1 nucleotidyltransferase domain-containing protein [Vibrio cincinnatiensis]MCG3731230.1 nucleotidyltransferase domain-containing protein [Vibrio cincinnatiensis]MCG3735048.1 nucleotidyltransferase domain-containing protein [Vibrio cincinnatiensis]MCG3738743.1 nucleotidyltransferase domain-containing protein [Vibrio cincinna